VKVKLLQSFSGAIAGYYSPKAGDVLDVDPAVGDDLVGRGKAEKVKTQRRTKKAPEAAVSGPDETAAKPKAEKRG
jgi:hypothetical protein